MKKKVFKKLALHCVWLLSWPEWFFLGGGGLFCIQLSVAVDVDSHRVKGNTSWRVLDDISFSFFSFSPACVKAAVLKKPLW